MQILDYDKETMGPIHLGLTITTLYDGSYFVKDFFTNGAAAKASGLEYFINSERGVFGCQKI